MALVACALEWRRRGKGLLVEKDELDTCSRSRWHSRWSGGGEVGELACAGSRVRGFLSTFVGHFVYYLRYPVWPAGREGKGAFVEDSSSEVVLALGDTRMVMWAEGVEGLLVEEFKLGNYRHPGWYISYTKYICLVAGAICVGGGRRT